MIKKAIRRGWLATWVLVLAVVTTPSMGLADVCEDIPPPYTAADCGDQVQAPVTYTGLQTQGWAYYCTGANTVFSSLGGNGGFTWDNSCFTVTEDVMAESPDPQKFDATITNWCFDTQSITVTLGCLNF